MKGMLHVVILCVDIFALSPFNTPPPHATTSGVTEKFSSFSLEYLLQCEFCIPVYSNSRTF